VPARRPRGRPRKTSDEAIARLIAFENLPPNEIAHRLGCGRDAVTRAIARCQKVDPGWPHAATIRAAAGLAGPVPAHLLRQTEAAPPRPAVDPTDPDSLEREATRVLLEVADQGDRDAGPRVASARALLELARDLRDRRPPEDTAEDEAEVEARILGALERAELEIAPPVLSVVGS
jgi:hypothetical protein